MAFKLLIDGRDTYFGDKASYRLKDSGTLVITDGEGGQFTYSPAIPWVIEEDERQAVIY